MRCEDHSGTGGTENRLISVRELVIERVGIKFVDWTANIESINLTGRENSRRREQFKKLGVDLKPEKAFVIFDGTAARLTVITGRQDDHGRAITYIQLIKNDPQDQDILVQGTTGLHRFGEAGHQALDLTRLIPVKLNPGGFVEIHNRGGDLIIERKRNI